MGSNMAEAHPVGFQWVMEARERGAKVIHVDPRFTRTSAVATSFVAIRAGTDIAFLGGIINYVLSHGREFREYVEHYTNASTIVSDDFRDSEDLDGLFSGFDPEKHTYDTKSWQYRGVDMHAAGGDRHGRTEQSGTTPERDPTLQNPRCVFQLLKRHFSRYTPEAVAEICGIEPAQLISVAEQMASNSGRERTTAIAYAVGWTHHSVGVQYIRTAAILQLLLGNIGRPGGGILALRGHASIQGSTDIPTLFDLLPGYMPMPEAGKHESLASYLKLFTPRGGFWGHFDTYMVSLLKAYWGEKATSHNDFCFGHIPRLTGKHSTFETMKSMIDGKVRGFFIVGENPASGSVNGKLQRKALGKLDWLVVRDLVEIESASFWYNGPEIATGEQSPETIGTEVFFMPAASHTEKDGSFTNTQRLLQWHHKAVEPKGDCRSELWFYYHLGVLIRRKLKDSTDPRDRAILDLAWEYPTIGKDDEPDANAILREFSGYDETGKALGGYTELKADGTTTSGCWIYCGVFKDGENQAARRKPASEQTWVAPDWGWAWPMNRRMLYNRASADPDGKPWSERKKYVFWDEKAAKWRGPDVPDFKATMRPDYVPKPDSKAEDALSGSQPFIMQEDGVGWLFTPDGVSDAPFPTHYEPQESPFANGLYDQQSNPARLQMEDANNRYNPSGEDPGADVYPYVFTTYRLTEHHTAGGMSRSLSHLTELQPEMFCEVSPELARDRGLENGGWATIVTARAAIEARVLVTERMQPLGAKNGRTVHQVGLPYHWGWQGLSTGDSANDLLSIVLDPNVSIQESKVATCDIVAGRRPRGPELVDFVESYRKRGALVRTPEHVDG